MHQLGATSSKLLSSHLRTADPTRTVEGVTFSQTHQHSKKFRTFPNEFCAQSIGSIIKQLSIFRCFLALVVVAALVILYHWFPFPINWRPTGPIETLPPFTFNGSQPVGRIYTNLTLPTWRELQEKYRTDRFMLAGSGLLPVDEFDLTHRTVSSNYHLPMFSKQHLALWYPKGEKAPKTKVAIIIPYRNRSEHLRIWLNNLPPFLCKQNLYFAFIIVEQVGTVSFNRAALFNVGFLESNRLDNFDCFIMHDVDMIPEDDRLPYRCGEDPIHLAVALNRDKYKLIYDTFVGGVLALSRSQFTRLRGFSNVYFGWGGEDDDIYQRMVHQQYTLKRHPIEISRFMTIQHKRDETNQVNPIRYKLLRAAKHRFSRDGYPETKYRLESFGPRFDNMVYWISVDLSKNQGRTW